jgi:hypothetical protein
MTAEQAWDSLIVASVGPDVDNCVLRRGDDEKMMSIPGAVSTEVLNNVISSLKAAGMTRGGGKKKGPTERGLASQFEGAKPQERFGMVLARASELTQPAPETHFLRVFGQSDRLVADTATTDGSVPQALMLMNGGVGQLLSDPNCAAVVAAGNGKTDDEKVDSVYLAFLSRKPTDKERTAAKGALKTGLGLSDVAWAVANTREFLFIQ